MGRQYHSLAAGDLTQDWSNTALLALADDWSALASIEGFRGDNLDLDDPRLVTGTSDVVDVNVNLATPDSYTTGGVAEFDGIDDPVVAIQGSGTADAPYLAFYLNTTGRQDVSFAARLRDIDAGTTATQQIAVQFRVGDSGDWINVDGGYVANANVGTDTPISVTLPDAADDQPQVQVRIITIDAPGSDAFIGIDDIVISSEPLAPPPAPWINEFHYDNGGADTGEAIEVAGVAGTDLTGWNIVLYNGSNGQSYQTIVLSGTIDDEGDGYGALSFAAVGLQNGAPDGFALVAPDGSVVEFVSYEGAMTATNGPAVGLTSIDVGVVELGTEPAGLSLQRTGAGLSGGDFGWTGPIAASLGSVNAGQSFGEAPPPAAGALSIADSSVVEGDSGTTLLAFTVTRAGGSAGAVAATWTLTPGTAGADDFAGPLTGTVAFADGQTSATIEIAVAGDTLFEGDESFGMALSAPTGGATIADGDAAGTIVNDDAAPPAPPANVFINEIHYDDASTDEGEAVEVAGAAGTDLTGWSIVLYNGNGGASYATIALAGTLPDQGSGFGTVSVATPGIQNGSPDGIALVDAAGRVVQFLSYEGVMTATNGPAAGLTSIDIGVAEEGVPEGQSLQLKGTGAGYADFVWTAASDDSFGAINTGQSFIAADATGQLSIRDASVEEGDAGSAALSFTVRRAGGSATAASVDYTVVLDAGADADDFAAGMPLTGTVSFAAGQAEATITLDVRGDTVGEGNEGVRVLLSNPLGNVAIADGEALGTIVNDDLVTLSIGAIQGRGHASAYAGQAVRTGGIVTAVDSNGYWIQDGGDGDAATSDGIFVFTGGAPTGVQVGDALDLTGTVSEFLPGADGLSITQIGSATATVLSSGNALPAAVRIGTGGLTPPSDTIEDDGFTSFDPANDGLDFYEALEGMRVTIDAPRVVDATNGFGETLVVASNGAGATGLNDRGGMTISAGDFNPERIQIDDDAAVFAGFVPAYTQGDRLGDVTGIVNYAFNSYEVIVTEAVALVEDTAPLPPERADFAGDAEHLTIASFNVENLDPGDLSFDLLAEDIVYSLRAPDIIGVQEIQDADGAGNGADLSGTLTAATLIAAIERAGGPTYAYVEVAPTTAGTTGGEPGGNIRNGYFYRTDRVDYVEGSASLIEGSPYAGSRRPLVADFVFNGETVTAINVHFTSRGGSDPLYGANQPPANAGEAAREAQAAGVLSYVNEALAGDPSRNFAVLGDFNGFYFEAAQQQLTAGGVFTNLATLLPEEERYSYLFEGNYQLLDNILVTGGLLDGARYDAVHINAGQAGATSDHDPQLAALYIARPNAAPIAAADAVAANEDATTGNLVPTLLANDTDEGALTIVAVDTAGTKGSVIFDATTQTLRYVADADAFDGLANGATTTDRFTYTVRDAGGLESSAAVTVTMTGIDDSRVRVGSLLRDNISGTAGEDTIYGLTGNDTLRGLDGRDDLWGGIGDDLLDGGNGSDRVSGGIGQDTLLGGAGDDYLSGGFGKDVLTGGTGVDRFAFSWLSGSDTITDFEAGTDLIRLEDGVDLVRSQVRDVNRDGKLDLTLIFSLGADVTLLGIDALAKVGFERGDALMTSETVL